MLARIIAVLLTVILQFDMLDYIKEQIPTSIQSSSEWTVQEIDGIEDINTDTSLSLQRTRSIKKIRTRVFSDLPNIANEYTFLVEQSHFLKIPSSIDSIIHGSLRTLFCVFRI